MFHIRNVTIEDFAFWNTLDKHISHDELALKARDQRGYVICDGDLPVGVMRYNLFWDNTPFLTMIHLKEAYHGKGFGRQAMLYWENEMRSLGFTAVLTSTQADEPAQHFYRKLSYIDKGCLLLDHTPLAQSMEIILLKVL